MSTKVHGTTSGKRAGHGLANDARVSPIEGAGAAPKGGVTRATTTPDCSQRISSVVTPNSRKSTSFQSKPRSPCTELASRGRAVPGRPPSWRTWGRWQCAVRCPRMSRGETTLHMFVKKMSEDDSVQKKPPSTTPRTRCQNCKSKNRPPSGQNCGHRAPNAHRADNERSVDLLLHASTRVLFHLETNMPKCRRANSGVLIMQPPEKYVSEGDGEKVAPLVKPPTRSQTERPEDPPSGREQCNEKSKGTDAVEG